jgi:UDP-N-acetylmuramoylalanine--D-glutamate ligase
VYRFGGNDGDVCVQDGVLTDRESGLRLPASEIRLFGKHNLDNACASALLARLAGVSAGAIADTLRAFTGLPHRMHLVRSLDGVDYYDDSKATNVGATAAALDGLADRLGKVVLIAGGKDKGGDYGPMVQRMQRMGRSTVLIGEAADIIERALSAGGCASERAPSLERAVERARALAKPGDVVLLAPACASFDMFRSYAHRGDVFAAAVTALDTSSRPEVA